MTLPEQASLPFHRAYSSEELLGLLDEDESHFEARFVPDLDQLARVCEMLRSKGRRLVLTSGSFDIIHEGHSMYLEAARTYGDCLVVGVDSDAKVRDRKGPGRPAVPEEERVRMVVHQRGVGLVTLKQPDHPRWELIRQVQPDVLVATRETYSDAEADSLRRDYGVRLVVLDRMATISTSARLRQLQFDLTRQFAHGLQEHLPVWITDLVVQQITRQLEGRLPELMKELLPSLLDQVFNRVTEQTRS